MATDYRVRDDRSRERKARMDELARIKSGEWPLSINEMMRWYYSGPDYAERMCVVGIDYLDNLEQRLAEGDPDLEGWGR